MFSYVSDIYGLVSMDNIYRYHFFKRGSGGSQSVLIFDNGGGWWLFIRRRDEKLKSISNMLKISYFDVGTM